jgi:hypothetical protein
MADVQKIIGTSYTSMGTGGVRKDNAAVAISGIILTTADFNFLTVAAMSNIENWKTGVKQKKVFPFFGLDSYEDQSTDATIYESPAQRRKLLRLGKKRFMFNFDLPLDAHKAMQSYRNGDLRMFIVEEDGKIRFYNTGADGSAGNPIVKGFTTSLVNPGKMKEVAPDGNAPALSSLYIDLENYREWDESGDIFYPSWEATDLEPLVPVKLIQKTTSTTSILLEVGSVDGYETSGLEKKVLISGIAIADIVLYQSNGTTVVSTTNVDNSNGTYTLTGTGFATGMIIKLKTPDVMASTGLLIDMKAPLAITVPLA